MALYQLINLDVWGNARDGFEVNDRYATSTYVSIPEDSSDAEIVKILKDEGIIKKGIRTASVEIDGDFEYSLYINEKKTGRPGFELMRVEERGRGLFPR